VTASHSAEIATFLFEHARDILLVIDGCSGRIVDANEAAELAYGYSRSDLLARTIFEIRAADPETVPAQMAAANNEGILFRTVHQRRDGSTFPVEVNSRGHAFGGRRMLLSVVRDISERCRFEAEREALIATTRRALELREEFLVIVSHELRAPVTNVSLHLQQLMRQLERGSADARITNATEDALAEIARLSSLISTLLDAQQVAGEIVLARGVVDLADLVNEVVTRLRRRAELAGSPLRVAVPAVRGDWDRLRLEQVLTNLLVNALKYGGGQPIDVSGSIEDAHALVEVRDRGIGIAAEDAERIFEKFARAVPPAYGGLGLGLYIVRRLVEAHGGTITVESALGCGSTFRLRLPLRDAAPAGALSRRA
jgi:two-component system sensor kinase FixL